MGYITDLFNYPSIITALEHLLIIAACIKILLMKNRGD